VEELECRRLLSTGAALGPAIPLALDGTAAGTLQAPTYYALTVLQAAAVCLASMYLARERPPRARQSGATARL
jgi:hypothetical protein